MHNDLVEAFRILELNPTSEPAAIKTAYMDLVKVWHPDRHQLEGERLREKSQEKLKRVNWAYETITKHLSNGGTIDNRGSSDGPHTNTVREDTSTPGFFADLFSSIDQKICQWTVSTTIVQRVALSKPCNISFPFTVSLVSAGVTYIKVTMPAGQGCMATLRAEIAGCGILCN